MEPRLRKSGRFLLACECAFIFLLIPTLGFIYQSRLSVVLGLLAMSAYAAFVLHNMPGFSWHENWQGRRLSKREFKIIGARFLVSTLGVLLLAYCYAPDKLFAFPAQRPVVWLLVMLLYPFASALPQEILFRSFFFRRYARLFHKKGSMLLASAFAFGYVHIVFGNPIAPLLSLICGYYLASSYFTHHSLKKVTIEHAFYGNMVFTIGLGYYFITHTI